MFVIYDGSASTKISRCLSVNLKAFQRIQKELYESNCNYESTESQKPYSDHPVEKRTLTYFAENIDPSNSIRSTDMDMRISKFFTWQVVNEDI